MAHARSAPHACWISWNCNWKRLRRLRLRTSLPPKWLHPRPAAWRHSCANAAPQPFPDHLPRERVIVPGPTSCACCGGSRLSKLGEDVTETLEVIPRQWKVIQHVREKFSCRDCETIAQAPAPFHVIPRGGAGPSLLAMILFEKFGQHQPLNRQAERYTREGVPISLSTLADQVGACTMALRPIFERLEAYVLTAERLHGDDTSGTCAGRGQDKNGAVLGLCPRRPTFWWPSAAGRGVLLLSRSRR